MSVYKLEKKDSKIEYLELSSELRKTVMSFFRPFPVAYERIAVNGITEIVISINRNCFIAYASYLGKGNATNHDIKERRKHFHKAYVQCMMLMADLKYLFDRMREGQNFYKRNTFYNRFEIMVSLINQLRKNIKETMKVDLTHKKNMKKNKKLR